MLLSNQVCSFDQAKQLKELGIEASGIFTWYWCRTKRLKDEFYLVSDTVPYDNRSCTELARYYAYTVAELGVMLPNYTFEYKGSECIIKSYKIGAVYYCDICSVGTATSLLQIYSSESEGIAKASLLLCLIKNKDITAEEVNQRLKAA